MSNVRACRSCGASFEPNDRGRPRLYCYTCRPVGVGAPKPTTRRARAAVRRWRVGRTMDLSDDTLRNLWRAAERHTPDLAEQALIVCWAALAGRSPEQLQAKADHRYHQGRLHGRPLGLLPQEDDE